MNRKSLLGPLQLEGLEDRTLPAGGFASHPGLFQPPAANASPPPPSQFGSFEDGRGAVQVVQFLEVRFISIQLDVEPVRGASQVVQQPGEVRTVAAQLDAGASANVDVVRLMAANVFTATAGLLSVGTLGTAVTDVLARTAASSLGPVKNEVAPLLFRAVESLASQLPRSLFDRDALSLPFAGALVLAGSPERALATSLDQGTCPSEPQAEQPPSAAPAKDADPLFARGFGLLPLAPLGGAAELEQALADLRRQMDALWSAWPPGQGGVNWTAWVLGATFAAAALAAGRRALVRRPAEEEFQGGPSLFSGPSLKGSQE